MKSGVRGSVNQCYLVKRNEVLRAVDYCEKAASVRF